MSNYIQQFANKLSDKQHEKEAQTICANCMNQSISSICINLECLQLLCSSCYQSHALTYSHNVEDLSAKSLKIDLLCRDASLANNNNPKWLDKFSYSLSLFHSLTKLTVKLSQDQFQSLNAQNSYQLKLFVDTRAQIVADNLLLIIFRQLQINLFKVEILEVIILNGRAFSQEAMFSFSRLIQSTKIRSISCQVKSESLSPSSIQDAKTLMSGIEAIPRNNSISSLFLNIQCINLPFLPMMQSLKSLPSLQYLSINFPDKKELTGLEIELSCTHFAKLKLLSECHLSFHNLQIISQQQQALMPLIRLLNTNLLNVRLFSLTDSMKLDSLDLLMFFKCKYLTILPQKARFKQFSIIKRYLLKLFQLCKKVKLFTRTETIQEILQSFILPNITCQQ